MTSRTRRRIVVIALVVVVAVAIGAAVGVGMRDDNDTAKSTRPATTSTIATTATTRVDSEASPPPAAGYFAMLPPGRALPTGAQCAARVRRSPWEPRPANTEANHSTPPAALDLGTFSQWNNTWNAAYRTRIDGNFEGTTDEIAQWAACKWGWSDNLVRAQMVQESHWRQSTEGDLEPRANGNCVSGDTRDPCPTSFSIIQVKWYHHPAASSSQSSYPWIKRSTAFALDLQLAEMRGCYEGMSTYLGNTRGDVIGCLDSWFTGSWTPGGGSYAGDVKLHLASQPWLQWKG